MNIALVGYGKMGHMVKSAAENLGHTVAFVCNSGADVERAVRDNEFVTQKIDGIIEFTRLKSALKNLETLLPLGVPIVCGTTGWDAHQNEIAEYAKKCGGVVLKSSNFSLGVNLFYKIIEQAAFLLADYDEEYDAAIWEVHHNQKKDAPSGTALEIARRIQKAGKYSNVNVAASRVGRVPGTHSVIFDSEADTIELTHTARSRSGFAQGSVRALEKLVNAVNSGALRKGAMYSMEDVLFG
ncbi:MAG: 4-hydroxy-tetrahydrodipicolinate reductase [Treponemataceae bacterium]|nr:MAG: 4-hydroxy-tetrahydrodipicolinate reductase [Treponemataceae bacterium]